MFYLKNTSDPKSSQKKETKKSGLRENIEAITIAILLALFIRTFVVQAFKIPSGSMKETLQIGDHILVSKFIYGIKLPFVQKTIIPIKKPKKEDIIVFRYPENPKLDFIKRVVGVEGDVIKVRNKKLYVNDQLVDQEYAIHTDPHIIPEVYNKRDNFGPVSVPPDALFVMGDNRDNSKDSRFWGFVNLQAVKGKAFMIYWSWNKNNSQSLLHYVRWGRIFDILR